MEKKTDIQPAANASVTLEDLLESESSVLSRLAEELDGASTTNMAGHYSNTNGHNSSGSHTSHTSAVKEKIV
ncbi:hypothetical protein [Paraburkholderia sp. RL17-347-BIC-D]|uniref:hypothetical protein n=1 Tax=Paraburkholderia sp. RL17-347-BIC-D TaxID=3031632 RepID=UPI0038BBAE6C